MIPTSLRSMIEYRSAPAPEDAETTPHVRGCEWLSVTRYPDGTTMYRSQSENYDKALVRDVLMRLDHAWRPVECFFDLRVGGEHAGSMRYRFGPGYARGDGWNRQDGACHLDLPCEGTPAGFCPHPVSSDALLLAAYDHAAGGRQSPGPYFMSSTDLFGATGPSLAPITLSVEYLGRAPLDTPAGPLSADRYAFPLGDASSGLTEQVWCLAGTPLFLRASIEGASYPTAFVTTKLEIGGYP